MTKMKNWMRLLQMGTQKKTTLILGAAFLLLVFITLGLVYISQVSYSHNDFYRLLNLRARSLAAMNLEDFDLNELQEVLIPGQLLSENDFIIPLSADTDIDSIANSLELPLTFFENLLNQGQAQHQYRENFALAVLHNYSGENYAVVVKAENYYENHHFAFLRKVLLLVLGLGAVLAGLIGYFLAQQIFTPLGNITAKVNQINTESLYLRLQELQGNSELSALVSTFNNMLDRLETAFETQNNFISNASHEFRTPLTAIIGESDVALSKERTVDDYKETLRIILHEAEKLDKKTQALLFLAQTGFRSKTFEGEILRLDELLWDVKVNLLKINPKAQIIFDFSELPENSALLRVKGNGQLLHLALSNILSNACKYSDNRPVKLSLKSTQHKLLVAITDSGIGIPSAELQRIYDPFFRASNTQPYEGYGIGLPLARNIVRMHSGEIKVSSVQDEGTSVHIILPTDDGNAGHSSEGQKV